MKRYLFALILVFSCAFFARSDNMSDSTFQSKLDSVTSEILKNVELTNNAAKSLSQLKAYAISAHNNNPKRREEILTNYSTLLIEIKK